MVKPTANIFHRRGNPPSASNFQGILSQAHGGNGASTAREAARLASGNYVLAQSGVQVPLTGSVVATTLATINVPANAMGPNGRLRISALWSYTNSANSKTLSIRFGGTLFHNLAVTTTAQYKTVIEIANRNSTTSQICTTTGLTSGQGTSTGAVVAGAIATASAQDILIQGTLANSGETINLEHYLVELLAGAAA